MTPQVCRVCLQIADDPIDMTFALYRGKIRVTEMFKKCTEIQVQNEKDNILCKECEKRLFDAYEFRCQAKEAEKALQKHVPSGFVDVKKEKMLVDDDEIDFYWQDEVTEPIVTIVKKEETTQPETKVKRTGKKRVSFQLPGTTNRFQCRFCLKIFVEGLREHEKQHISKNHFYFYYLIYQSITITFYLQLIMAVLNVTTVRKNSRIVIGWQLI